MTGKRFPFDYDPIDDLSLLDRFQVSDQSVSFKYKFFTGQQLVDFITENIGIEKPKVDYIDFRIGLTAPAYNDGRLFYDKVNKCLSFYDDISGTSVQLGQENYFWAVNDETVTIKNGEVFYISGHDGTNKLVKYADATSREKSLGTIGFATHDIDPGKEGKFTRIGTVRELNTLGCSPGSTIYLSTTPGQYTDIAPSSPFFLVPLGLCSRESDSLGEIEAKISWEGNTEGVITIFNGAVLEPTTILTFEDTGNLYLTIEKEGGGNISLFFDGVFDIFDSTPAASIQLIPGTDTVPIRNYVYIPKDTKQLTISQIGFPTTQQYVPIADIIVPSVSKVISSGFYKVHLWTDHISDDIGRGHLQHVNYWIRRQHATYEKGAAITTTPAENVSASLIDIATTVAEVLQLHVHSFPAFNTASGSKLYIQNDPTILFKEISNLNSTDISQDSSGGLLAGRFYSIVMWGVVSEESSDCKIFINLPSGSYNTEARALDDISSFTNFNILKEYKGTGFLMYKFTLQNSGSNIRIIENGIESLLGNKPGVGGGGAGTGGIENFPELLDVPSSYSGEALKILRVNAGEVGLEFATLTADIVNDSTTTNKFVTQADIDEFHIQNTDFKIEKEAEIVKNGVVDNAIEVANNFMRELVPEGNIDAINVRIDSITEETLTLVLCKGTKSYNDQIYRYDDASPFTVDLASLDTFNDVIETVSEVVPAGSFNTEISFNISASTIAGEDYYFFILGDAGTATASDIRRPNNLSIPGESYDFNILSPGDGYKYKRINNINNFIYFEISYSAAIIETKAGYSQVTGEFNVLNDAFFAEDALSVREATKFVGIGTINPSEKLEVSGGNIKYSTPLGQSRFLFVGANDEVTDGIQQIIDSTNNIKVQLNSAGDSFFADGMLGIGLNNPTSKLHISEDTVQTNTTVGLTVEQAGIGDALVQFVLTGARRWVTGIDNSDNDKFKIASSLDLDSNARLTIDTDGNVGIGTITPSQELDVNGKVKATSFIVGSSEGVDGSFTSADSKTITVTKGLITSIV